MIHTPLPLTAQFRQQPFVQKTATSPLQHHPKQRMLGGKAKGALCLPVLFHLGMLVDQPTLEAHLRPQLSRQAPLVALKGSRPQHLLLRLQSSNFLTNRHLFDSEIPAVPWMSVPLHRLLQSIPTLSTLSRRQERPQLLPPPNGTLLVALITCVVLLRFLQSSPLFSGVMIADHSD